MKKKYTYQDLIKREARRFVNLHSEKISQVIKESATRTKYYVFYEVFKHEFDLDGRIWEYTDSIWYDFLRLNTFQKDITELDTWKRIIKNSQTKMKISDKNITLELKAFHYLKIDITIEVIKILEQLFKKVKWEKSKQQQKQGDTNGGDNQSLPTQNQQGKTPDCSTGDKTQTTPRPTS